MKGILTWFKNNPYRYFTVGFMLAEAVLYAVMLGLDIATDVSTVAIRYTGVWLCLIYGAVGAFVFRERNAILTAVALGFTLLADFFLLVLDDFYEIGVACFLVTQTLYAVRIFMTMQKSPKISMWVRFAFVALLVLILREAQSMNLLTILVAFYFPNLVGNAVDAFRLKGKDSLWLLLGIGLTLFIGCDVCVGLFNFESVLAIKVSQGVLDFATIGMWAFYLPSQVLIALSSYNVFKEKKV